MSVITNYFTIAWFNMLSVYDDFCSISESVL